MVQKKWNIAVADQGIAHSLEQGANISPVTAQLLAIRGVTRSDAARSFLESKLLDLRPPESLPGARLAAELIFDAIRQNQKIAIYGDYDADGMTSTAILWRCLKMFDADVVYYVPNRLDDGYGLNVGAIDDLNDRGVQFIITVDCGIASHREVARAKSYGMTVVISDHHQPSENFPDADAIVHPGIEGYPFSGLCGAGVALKIAWALCKRVSGSDKVSPAGRQFLLTALGLAAIGTVADVVPLVDENRIIAKHGLVSLKTTEIEGLRQLMRLTELDKKPALSAEDIGFTLGPRLNAAGRLGQAQLAVELLTSPSTSRVAALADYINKLNSSRDSIERKITKAANQQLKDRFDPEHDPAIVLSDDEWHKGVIGIVAGRLAEKHHRPTIVISSDIDASVDAVGSGRSSMGIDLYQALSECEEHLVSFGGHRAAAGLKIKKDQIDLFRESFFESIMAQANVLEMVPELNIDVEVGLSQLTLSALNEIEKLAPFGQENPRPLLCANEVTLSAPPKRIGEGGRHLSLQLEQHGVKLRGVAFGNGDWAEELQQVPGPIDVVFRPVINEFRGRRSVEVQLVDWRKAASLVASV